MFYDDKIVEEIIQCISIGNYIGNYTKLRRENGYLIGLCPFHKESTESFYVDYKNKKYHCCGCGANGNIINFAMHINNCSFEEAIEILAKRANIKLPEIKKMVNQEKEDKAKEKFFNMNRDAAKFYYRQLYNKRGTEGMQYFEKRKLSKNTIQKFGLGYAPKYGDLLYKELTKKRYTKSDMKKAGLIGIDKNGNPYDKFWNRVMYPIMNEDNKIIGFGGRVLDDSKPKYLNSSETIVFNKSENLYGLNLARYTDRPYFICCEGYMDVIAMHQAGFTNAVASLGTALTKQQVKLISNYVDTVYLAYDSDGPGLKAGQRAVELFNEVGITTKRINMSPVKDPDEFIKEFGTEAFEKRIKNAESSERFLVQSTKILMESEIEENPAKYYDYVAEILLQNL